MLNGKLLQTVKPKRSRPIYTCESPFRYELNPSTDSIPDDDHHKALAEHYAAFWNDLERCGLEPTDQGIWKVADELAGGEWVLFHDHRDGFWKVVHHEEAPKVVRHGRDAKPLRYEFIQGHFKWQDEPRNKSGEWTKAGKDYAHHVESTHQKAISQKSKDEFAEECAHRHPTGLNPEETGKHPELLQAWQKAVLEHFFDEGGKHRSVEERVNRWKDDPRQKHLKALKAAVHGKNSGPAKFAMPRLFVYRCPYCGGIAYQNDPIQGGIFQGYALCSRCGRGFSILGKQAVRPATYAAQVKALRYAFDPKEPRDEGGRWTGASHEELHKVWKDMEVDVSDLFVKNVLPELEKAFHPDKVPLDKQWLRDGISEGLTPQEVFDSIANDSYLHEAFETEKISRHLGKITLNTLDKVDPDAEDDSNAEDATNEWLDVQLLHTLKHRKPEIMAILEQAYAKQDHGDDDEEPDGGQGWLYNRHGRPLSYAAMVGILRYAAARIPKGYVVNKDGRVFRAGMWVNQADLALAVPATQNAAPAADGPVAESQRQAAYHVEKRRARGPVNRDALHAQKLQTHAHQILNKAETTRAKRTFAGLHQHHGELTAHRVEELINGAHEALQHVHPDDEITRDRLSKRLKSYQHMLDWHDQKMNGRQPWEGGQAEHGGKVYNMPAMSIVADPDRFQFKLNVNKEGVTQELKGVKKWDPELAGVISVWKDPADGKTYVINGHHRLELAKRMGVKNLNVMYIDAPNAKVARARGALVNIAEGRGTAVDAAKFMRDTGTSAEAMQSNGISLTGKVAGDAVTLTHLNDRLFNQVAMGKMPVDRAITIAGQVKDHFLQDLLVNRMDKEEAKGRDISPRLLGEMARAVAEAPRIKAGDRNGGQPDLFGSVEDEDSAFVEECDLKGFVRAELAKDVNDWKAVSSKRRVGKVAGEGSGNELNIEGNRTNAQEAAIARGTFDRLSNRSGLISDTFKKHAVDFAKAQTQGERDAIKQQCLADVRDAIDAESAGAGSQPVPSDAGGNEPGLPRGAAGPQGDQAVPAQATAADAGRGDAGAHGVAEAAKAQELSPGKMPVSYMQSPTEKQSHVPDWKDPPHETSPWLSDSDKKIEQDTQHRARTQYDQLKKQYIAKNGTTNPDGSLKSIQLNTDEWRGLFPEYHGTNASAVHEASAYLNKRLLNEALRTMRGKGNNTLAVLAGGGGSGKGTAVGQFMNVSDYPIVVDQVSDQVQKVDKMLDAAKAAGYDSSVIFVDRNPKDAWLGGVVPRAVNARKKGQPARTVPLAVALKANLEARKATIAMLKEGKHQVKVIDNNRGHLKAVLHEDPKAALAYLEGQQHDEAKLKEELEHATYGLHESGQIPSDIAEGLIGAGAIAHRRGQSGRPQAGAGGGDNAGSGAAGPGAGTSPEGAAHGPADAGSPATGQEAKPAADVAPVPGSYHEQVVNSSSTAGTDVPRGVKGTLLNHLATSGHKGMSLDELRTAMGQHGQHAEEAIKQLGDRVEQVGDRFKVKGATQEATPARPPSTRKKAEQSSPPAGSYAEQIAANREADQRNEDILNGNGGPVESRPVDPEAWKAEEPYRKKGYAEQIAAKSSASKPSGRQFTKRNSERLNDFANQRYAEHQAGMHAELDALHDAQREKLDKAAEEAGGPTKPAHQMSKLEYLNSHPEFRAANPFKGGGMAEAHDVGEKLKTQHQEAVQEALDSGTIDPDGELAIQHFKDYPGLRRKSDPKPMPAAAAAPPADDAWIKNLPSAEGDYAKQIADMRKIPMDADKPFRQGQGTRRAGMYLSIGKANAKPNAKPKAKPAAETPKPAPGSYHEQITKLGDKRAETERGPNAETLREPSKKPSETVKAKPGPGSWAGQKELQKKVYGEVSVGPGRQGKKKTEAAPPAADSDTKSEEWPPREEHPSYAAQIAAARKSAEQPTPKPEETPQEPARPSRDALRAAANDPEFKKAAKAYADAPPDQKDARRKEMKAAENTAARRLEDGKTAADRKLEQDALAKDPAAPKPPTREPATAAPTVAQTPPPSTNKHPGTMTKAEYDAAYQQKYHHPPPDDNHRAQIIAAKQAGHKVPESVLMDHPEMFRQHPEWANEYPNAAARAREHGFMTEGAGPVAIPEAPSYAAQIAAKRQGKAPPASPNTPAPKPPAKADGGGYAQQIREAVDKQIAKQTAAQKAKSPIGADDARPYEPIDKPGDEYKRTWQALVNSGFKQNSYRTRGQGGAILEPKQGWVKLNEQTGKWEGFSPAHAVRALNEMKGGKSSPGASDTSPRTSTDTKGPKPEVMTSAASKTKKSPQRQKLEAAAKDQGYEDADFAELSDDEMDRAFGGALKAQERQQAGVGDEEPDQPPEPKQAEKKPANIEEAMQAGAAKASDLPQTPDGLRAPTLRLTGDIERDLYRFGDVDTRYLDTLYSQMNKTGLYRGNNEVFRSLHNSFSHFKKRAESGDPANRDKIAARFDELGDDFGKAASALDKLGHGKLAEFYAGVGGSLVENAKRLALDKYAKK